MTTRAQLSRLERAARRMAAEAEEAQTIYFIPKDSIDGGAPPFDVSEHGGYEDAENYYFPKPQPSNPWKRGRV